MSQKKLDRLEVIQRVVNKQLREKQAVYICQLPP